MAAASVPPAPTPWLGISSHLLIRCLPAYLSTCLPAFPDPACLPACLPRSCRGNKLLWGYDESMDPELQVREQ